MKYWRVRNNLHVFCTLILLSDLEFNKTLEVEVEHNAIKCANQGQLGVLRVLFQGRVASPQGPRGRLLPGAAPPPSPPPLFYVKNLPNVSLRRTQITVKAQNRRYHYQHSCFKILKINCLTAHFFFLLQTLFKKELIIFGSCYFQICLTTPGGSLRVPQRNCGGTS